jgi:hypothetical protein
MIPRNSAISLKSVPTLRCGNSKSDEKAKMSTLIALKSENVTELEVYHRKQLLKLRKREGFRHETLSV